MDLNEITAERDLCEWLGARMLRDQLWRQGTQVGRRHVTTLMLIALKGESLRRSRAETSSIASTATAADLSA